MILSPFQPGSFYDSVKLTHSTSRQLLQLLSETALTYYSLLLFFSPGTLIVLKHPYPHKVEEPSIYESVRVHTAMQTGRTENDLVPNAPSVSSSLARKVFGGLSLMWLLEWAMSNADNSSLYVFWNTRSLHQIRQSWVAKSRQIKPFLAVASETASAVCSRPRWVWPSNKAYIKGFTSPLLSSL